MIAFAGIVPHPPLLIPAIGKGEEKKILKTSLAMERLASDIAGADLDTLIVISPHMVHYPHLFNVCGMRKLLSKFDNYGFQGFERRYENDLVLANQIVDKSESEGLPAILYDNDDKEYLLDHGVSIPLYFIDKVLENSLKILPLGYSVASRAEHYTFGEIIYDLTKNKTERIGILASGDLSHRLNQKNGVFDHKAAERFDKEFLKLIKDGDDYSIINMDQDLVENAGECGYLSTLILLGAISGLTYKPEVYSYEGPFGVGYGVVNMNI